MLLSRLNYDCYISLLQPERFSLIQNVEASGLAVPSVLDADVEQNITGWSRNATT